MPEQIGDSDVASAFGMQTRDTAQAAEEMNVPTQEGSQTAEVQEETKKDGTQQEPLQETKDGDRDVERKARNAHKMLIDTIENQFKLNANGRMSDEELRQYFDEHPEVADVANRSKRVKDQFRSLMDRDQAAKVNPEIQSKREEQTRKDVDEIDDDDKPLTLKDLKRYQEEMEVRTLERTLSQDRMERIENFAVSKGIKDDDFTRFQKNVDALRKVNDDWTLEQALQAAHNSIRTVKDQPVNLSSSSSVKEQPESQSKDVDLTTPQAVMSWDEFVGKKK